MVNKEKKENKTSKIIITPQMMFSESSTTILTVNRQNNEGIEESCEIKITSPKSESVGWWYIQGNSYHATFRFLVAAIDSKVENSIFAIPAVYIYSIAVELYMKAFLLYHGLSSNTLRKKYSHDLEKIRTECSRKDVRFNNNDLVFITSRIAPIITDGGGMKYPISNGESPIYSPLMENVLNYLEKIIIDLVVDKI